MTLGSQQPVPVVWRPVQSAIVEALVREDPSQAGDLPCVDPVPAEVAEQIVEYVREYGETLISLPEEAWDTSVTEPAGTEPEDAERLVLVDLWTAGEGASDLVLHVHVRSMNGEPRFRVGLVYVP